VHHEEKRGGWRVLVGLSDTLADCSGFHNTNRRGQERWCAGLFPSRVAGRNESVETPQTNFAIGQRDEEAKF